MGSFDAKKTPLKISCLGTFKNVNYGLCSSYCGKKLCLDHNTVQYTGRSTFLSRLPALRKQGGCKIWSIHKREICQWAGSKFPLCRAERNVARNVNDRVSLSLP
jgi:hypothetical protein